MANFQEDFNAAAMVITGKFADMTEPKYLLDKEGKKVLGKDGQPVILEPAHPNIKPSNRMFYLKPYVVSTGLNGQRQIVNPTLQYVTKQYDANGWQTYVNFLINEVHKYTNTPNVNDPNFASNASGVAMSYKLWGSDQERKIQESLYKRGLRARLSACVAYWDKINALPGTNDVSSVVDMIKPNFDPNLPKNDDATAQLLQILSGIPELESQQTLREIAERITGVSADDEQQRIEDQQKYEAEQADKYDNGDTGIGTVFATGQEAVVGQQGQKDDKGEGDK